MLASATSGRLAHTYLNPDASPAGDASSARAGDIRRLYGPDNQILPVKDWPADMMPAIAGYRRSIQGGDRVLLRDGLAAICKLVDMASGAHGKPQSAMQVNVTVDRHALNQERVQELYGRYFTEDGRAKPKPS